MGVFGKTKSNTGGAGVHGLSEEQGGVGVYGLSNNGTGVVGQSQSGKGILAISETDEGVHGETKSQNTAAIAAYNMNPEGTGAAFYALCCYCVN